MLVATDIAARGIDVTALGHVINFDVPNVAEDYIHRVGRTARADAVGSAFTLVAPDEQTDLAAIERAIQKRLPRVTLPGFDYDAAKPPAAPPEPRSPQPGRGGHPRASAGGGQGQPGSNRPRTGKPRPRKPGSGHVAGAKLSPLRRGGRGRS